MNSDAINNQDWTTIVLKRRPTKKETEANGQKEAVRNEAVRVSKLEAGGENVVTKKTVQPESLQALIRKRIELKLNQEKADQLCSFPRNTFKEIEANRAVPTQEQQSRIQRHFGIQIKIHTEKTQI
jgi:DNA-binding XRE family transcriptional regulator